MRAILQRVTSASVDVEGETIGTIGAGALVLLGVETGDGAAEAARMADKLAGLRIFEDERGRMNRNANQSGAAFLMVSQFTLAASLGKGRRPSFDRAARPDIAAPLVEAVMADLEARGFQVASGRFGARMAVSLVNDGPVTFVIDVVSTTVAESA